MSMIAENYAQALYTLAKDEDLDTQILQQLEMLQASFAQEPEFLRLLGSHNLSKEERGKIADDSLRQHVHIYVLNFIKVLIDNGCVRCFADCVKLYRKQYNADRNILTVTAVTAVALSEPQTQKLLDKLTELTGKTVVLQNRIDPQCLGGVRLDYEGKSLDGTVKRQMETMDHLLKNTVL